MLRTAIEEKKTFRTNQGTESSTCTDHLRWVGLTNSENKTSGVELGLFLPFADLAQIGQPHVFVELHWTRSSWDVFELHKQFSMLSKKKWFTVIFSSSISNPDQNYEHSKKPSTHLGADIDIYFEDFENRQRRLIQEAMTIFCFLLNRCLNEYWSGTFAELWWC